MLRSLFTFLPHQSFAFFMRITFENVDASIGNLSFRYNILTFLCQFPQKKSNCFRKRRNDKHRRERASKIQFYWYRFSLATVSIILHEIASLMYNVTGTKNTIERRRIRRDIKKESTKQSKLFIIAEKCKSDDQQVENSSLLSKTLLCGSHHFRFFFYAKIVSFFVASRVVQVECLMDAIIQTQQFKFN